MERKQNSVFIISLIVLVGLGAIYLVGESLRQEDTEKKQLISSSELANSKMHMEKEVFDNPHLTSLSEMKNIGSGRSLETYYSRRAYVGAPPFIPHEVGTSLVKKDSCLSCHENGGFVKDWSAFAPVSPHPQYLNCRQCHVTQLTNNVFKPNNWTSVRPPLLGRSMLPGSPPPIPHSLQMRSKCLSCHSGAGSVSAIRIDHPDRVNCRQCHVPALEKGVFSR